MITGQYFHFETNGGVRAVLLRGKSPTLADLIEQRERAERKALWDSNHSQVQRCAMDTLESLRVLIAVDVHKQHPDLWDFESLLERIVNEKADLND